jgi:hypothetical protein
MHKGIGLIFAFLSFLHFSLFSQERVPSLNLAFQHALGPYLYKQSSNGIFASLKTSGDFRTSHSSFDLSIGWGRDRDLYSSTRIRNGVRYEIRHEQFYTRWNVALDYKRHRKLIRLTDAVEFNYAVGFGVNYVNFHYPSEMVTGPGQILYENYSTLHIWTPQVLLGADSRIWITESHYILMDWTVRMGLLPTKAFQTVNRFEMGFSASGTAKGFDLWGVLSVGMGWNF